MLTIIIERQASKFIYSLPDKQRKQIRKKIESLSSSGHMNDSIKLRGFEHYRADIGEYRIIYQINDSFINIYKIGKRNDGQIYKLMDRSGKKK